MKRIAQTQHIVVTNIPYRNIEERMVDALALRSDEGRSMAAIRLGKVPNNRYTRGFPNGETPLEREIVRKYEAHPGK